MSPFVLLSLCPYSMFIVALNKSATLSTNLAATIYNSSNAVDGKKYCTSSSPGAMSSPAFNSAEDDLRCNNGYGLRFLLWYVNFLVVIDNLLCMVEVNWV